MEAEGVMFDLMQFDDVEIANQAEKVINLLGEMLGKDCQSVQILQNMLWRFRFDATVGIRDSVNWSNVDMEYISAVRHRNRMLDAAQ